METLILICFFAPALPLLSHLTPPPHLPVHINRFCLYQHFLCHCLLPYSNSCYYSLISLLHSLRSLQLDSSRFKNPTAVDERPHFNLRVTETYRRWLVWPDHPLQQHGLKLTSRLFRCENKHSFISSAALKRWSVVHLGRWNSALYNTTPSSMPPPPPSQWNSQPPISRMLFLSPPPLLLFPLVP